MFPRRNIHEYSWISTVREEKRNVEGYKTSRFTTCALHQILFVWYNQEEWLYIKYQLDAMIIIYS